MYFTKYTSLNYIGKKCLDEAICYNSIQYLGTLYKKDYIVTSNQGIFSAYKIKEILKVNQEILFCQEINVLSYNTHLVSYSIGEDLPVYKMRYVKLFENLPIHSYTLPSNDTVIRIKNGYV